MGFGNGMHPLDPINDPALTPTDREANMKITLEPTGTIERVQGMPARVWKGHTDKGVEITCWIPIVQVRRDADNAEFERELNEIEVRRELVSFDLRMVI